MSRSSTSNSDSSWQVGPVGGLLRTAFVALAIVGLAELGARLVLGDDDDWRYWRIPVGERIDLMEARPTAPDVLFIGDSTAATNLVPETFMAHSPYTAFNLGTRGNLIGSFSPTMLDQALPKLRHQPKAFLVSFSSANYRDNDFFDSVTRQVNNSLFARSARGELIWGDVFALARLRHLIRRQIPHQRVDPHLDETHGWRPWEITHPQKRPNARTKVPDAPWSRFTANKTKKKKKVDPAKAAKRRNHKLNIVKRLGAFAGERQVVLVIPPIGKKARHFIVDQLRRRSPSNVRVWDYSDGDFRRGEGAHLREESARKFTESLARRFAREVQLD